MGPATGAVSACCPTYDQGPDSLPNDSCGECIEQGDDEEDYSDNRTVSPKLCCLPEATSTSLSLFYLLLGHVADFFTCFFASGGGGWVLGGSRQHF